MIKDNNQKEIRYSDLPIYEIEVDEEGNQGIRMISLVADPAISVMGMYFSSDIEQEFRFKSVKEQQTIVGPAMIPNKKILRKDNNDNYYYVYFTKETIKKMVEKFLSDGNNRSLNIDHSNQMVPGFIQGAWIVEDPTYDKSRYYGFNLPVGSFFIEVKIENKDFWLSEVKDEGRYGFSIEGLMNQKLVQMEKVSFDFDGTLSQAKIKKIAKEKIADGDDVYIITKRSENDLVKNVAKEIGIKPSNVIFTDHKPKWSFIKDLGIDTHYDNVESEAKEIEDKTKAKVELISSPVNYSTVIVDLPKYIDELIDDMEDDDIEEICEYFQDSYDDYPKAATENAKIALRWAEENGWGSCGTPVGKVRANQLAKGEPLTRNTIARMAAFERHRQNSQKDLGDGCGRLMWLAWGGDEGVEWAQRKLEQIDSQEFEFKITIDNVRSTNVDKIKYDTVSQELIIKFDDGSVYTYSNVPEKIYENVLDGMAGTKTAGEWGPIGKFPSVGAAVHQYLIEGGFIYKKGGSMKFENEIEEFIVEPKSGETKDEFVSRCIGVEINSGKPEDQAVAICYAKWDNK
jgi:hypothetical protein